ncbi:MAG: GTPase Era [Syntrophotaleaceae bacterium]
MQNEKTKIFRSGFVSIIGRPNVGKSTLLNAILGQKVAIASHKPQTTRNRILGICNHAEGQVLLLDTPGLHRAKGLLNQFMVEQALSACSDVDAILFLAEADDRIGGGDEYILEVLAKSKVPVILVLNKIDLVERPRLLPLIDVYSRKFPFTAIVPVSALTGEGVEDLVGTVIDLLPEGPQYYPEDMVTDLPERFIVAEMVREQILKQVHDEIPYGVAVTVDQFEEKPEKNLVVIQAVVHLEREAHKSIILGKGGAKIRSIGKAARYDIERLLGTRVFLELFVRVEKNWTQSKRLLKDFGYE